MEMMRVAAGVSGLTAATMVLLVVQLLSATGLPGA